MRFKLDLLKILNADSTESQIAEGMSILNNIIAMGKMVKNARDELSKNHPNAPKEIRLYTKFIDATEKLEVYNKKYKENVRKFSDIRELQKSIDSKIVNSIKNDVSKIKLLAAELNKMQDTIMLVRPEFNKALFDKNLALLNGSEKEKIKDAQIYFVNLSEALAKQSTDALDHISKNTARNYKSLPGLVADYETAEKVLNTSLFAKDPILSEFIDGDVAAKLGDTKASKVDVLKASASRLTMMFDADKKFQKGAELFEFVKSLQEKINAYEKAFMTNYFLNPVLPSRLTDIPFECDALKELKKHIQISYALVQAEGNTLTSRRGKMLENLAKKLDVDLKATATRKNSM